jgi:hypothetical protein
MVFITISCNSWRYLYGFDMYLIVIHIVDNSRLITLRVLSTHHPCLCENSRRVERESWAPCDELNTICEDVQATDLRFLRLFLSFKRYYYLNNIYLRRWPELNVTPRKHCQPRQSRGWQYISRGYNISVTPSQIYVIYLIILNVPFCHFVCAK